MADFERENLAALNFQREAIRQFPRQKTRNYPKLRESRDVCQPSINPFCISQ